MIKIEKTNIVGWEEAIRAIRNRASSWENSDSHYCAGPACPEDAGINLCKKECPYYKTIACENNVSSPYIVGPKDLDLMNRLLNSNTDNRKFMRMIIVYLDITAPLYWWTEFDAYKVGTVANSCSTMHKIADKEFTLEDFSCEHLLSDDDYRMDNFESLLYEDDKEVERPRIYLSSPIDDLQDTISKLNLCRRLYLDKSIKGDKKIYWWQMVQLLPSSYNQKRTVMLNYEVLANIYKSRKNHKLDEWIESLPYSELITGKDKKHNF